MVAPELDHEGRLVGMDVNSPQGMSFEEAAKGVVAMARFAGMRGWVPATSGNFSVRVDEKWAALTATGANKAELDEAGVIEAEIAGPKHPRASAEAPLHLVRYRAAPEIGAIAHVHGLAATVLSRRHEKAGSIRLEGWELLKAFPGIDTHEAHLDVPIVPNDQDTDRLAGLVEEKLAAGGPFHGYLIAGHGLYVWGGSAVETIRHMEAFDFLLTAQMYEEGAR
ncbi:methylthioribulose 1-phosphate dehydratase [Parvibaculum sp.]|jgi:methylthioribulose-1-phosphate dehydratase|uniref:methylthioribulose 1-phosphate dehydratase n=1 Tax=Parvibaculum sp. TaxID=2024848 RepID=UPI001B11F154|nr:methylthioribulose 1-phosphate dehydratase [Parvibaculum sp.]MBO6635817.1 methylthioribulose 1-phosphate dehydratase [Parvibaculum sp.]MBO6679200.1 methylthioribulose 1-phosphate dehydratase [Parvibaculum sp.]MBO6685927.1 methylthioribulose 1-phosphate dehydratase [Parvibaculum sp.]MBO6905954.1 methylthioribulose 1-phosphate dehydratase [Parvibaculum sp.]